MQILNVASRAVEATKEALLLALHGVNQVAPSVQHSLPREEAGQEGSVVVNRVKEIDDKDKGYDAQNEKYTNMITAGIIDPTKVVRTALQNAASIAALMLTTEALVSEIPEEEKKGMGGGGAPDMGGMGGMGGGF